jgi:hypothetical protein
MLKKLLILLPGLVFSLVSSGQTDFSVKMEAGFIKFHEILVDVDPAPGWKGNHLQDNPDGIDFTVFGGFNPAKSLFIGVGSGYVNFQGVNGMTITSDIEYEFLPTEKISPLMNARLGYNHIWNQYEGGTGSFLIELGAGGTYHLTDKISFYLRAGMMVVQEAILFPVRLGIKL